MRGVAAYADDFYFGASATSTANQNKAPGAPATPAAATSNGVDAAGGGGITTNSSMTGNPAKTAPASALNPIDLVPGLNGVNPLWAIPIFFGLIVIFKLLREWGHDSTKFAPLRVDLFWWAMTTLAAASGIPLLKALLNKFRIGPITDYVNNA